jgi:hypothetical protein
MLVNLYKAEYGALDNKKVRTNDSSEANSLPLRAEMPPKQAREQFNHFSAIVRGGCTSHRAIFRRLAK